MEPEARDLDINTEGDDVAELQRKLKKLGFQINDTAIEGKCFDESTKK